MRSALSGPRRGALHSSGAALRPGGLPAVRRAARSRPAAAVPFCTARFQHVSSGGGGAFRNMPAGLRAPLAPQRSCLTRHKAGKPRDVAQRSELIFEYCDVNGNGPLESTTRSFRALSLQLMRRVVPPESRADAVRGVICMTYMIEICLWVVITVALPAMVTDPKIAFFTEAQTGVVLAAGTLGSVIGKIVASAIMDSIHPLYAMICIMLSVAAANAAFSLGNSMAYFAVTWCIGRIIHASGWVAATRLICSWTPEETRGAALGSLAFSARIGFMAGGALMGCMLLRGMPWQSLFWAVSIAACVQSAVLFALVPADSPFSLSPSEDDDQDEGASAPSKSETTKLAEDAADDDTVTQITPDDASEATTRGEAVQDFVSSPQVWLAVISRCLLHVVYEFQAFLNLFAKQALHLSSGMAAQVAAGFSAGSAVAVLAGGFIFCRLMAGGRRNLTFALCAATAACFVGLLVPGMPAIVTIALVCLLGAAVSVPYYVPLPAYNIRRGGGFSAVLEGATETGAFGAAMLFDLAVGKLLGGGGFWGLAGWDGVLKILLVAAIGATVVTTAFMELERRLEVKALKEAEEAAAPAGAF